MRGSRGRPEIEGRRRGWGRALVALILVLGLFPAGAHRALAAGETISESLGLLPPGKTLTVVFDATISAAPTGTSVSNQGTLSGANFASVVTDDPDDGTSSADPTLTSLSFVDLEVTKSESIDPVVAGSGPGNLTYVVTVTNVGTAMATGVALSEVLTLPAGVTIDSITPSAGTSFSDPIWTVGGLAPSASATLTVVLTVDSSTAPGTDVIDNTATVTALDQSDPVPGNDSSTAATSVGAEADVVIAKDDAVTAVVPGGTVTYTIEVVNTGPSDDPSVMVTDIFPPNLSCTWTSAAAGGATGNTPGPVAGDISDTPSIPAFGSVTYTAVCAVDSGATGTLSNTATATTSVDEIDLGDNAATDADTALVPEVDVQVSKTESIDPVEAGSGAGNLTYQVTAFNAGPSDATGVTISEALTLPSGVSIDSIAPSAGTSFSDPTWTIPSLAAGSSATLTVVLTVDGTAETGTDVISNTATLTGVDQTETDAGNDVATESTSVLANQPPTITSLSSASQSVQYSDAITSVTVTAEDPDGDALTLSTTGVLPSLLTLTSNGCTGSGPSTCTFTLSGQFLMGAGTYPIEFTASDGIVDSNSETHTIEASAEDAEVTFDPGNPDPVLIPAASSPGGPSGPFTLLLDVDELDVPPGLAGDLGLGFVAAVLNPGAIPGVCIPAGITPGPADAGGPFDYHTAHWSCSFDLVPIGDYSVDVTVDLLGFYAATDSAPVSVVDPCPIPHDGSDTDGDGIPDACDCPCFDEEDLDPPGAFGSCIALNAWAGFYTEYYSWPSFNARVWQSFCWYQSLTSGVEFLAPVTPRQFLACRSKIASAAPSHGVTCQVY